MTFQLIVRVRSSHVDQGGYVGVDRIMIIRLGEVSFFSEWRLKEGLSLLF